MNQRSSPRTPRREMERTSGPVFTRLRLRGGNPPEGSRERHAERSQATAPVVAIGRTMLFASLVLLAGMVTRASAGVIDDFSGPRGFTRFANREGGGPNTTYGLDGQFRCRLPQDGAYTSFWYLTNTYDLAEDRPVEFRLDVASLNHAAAYAALAVNFPANPLVPGSGRYYGLFWFQNTVILWKGYDTNNYYYLNVPHTLVREPVTLSLTLTRQRDTMSLGAKVIRRDEPREILFALATVDGPEIEGEGDNGPPPAGPVNGVGVGVGNVGGLGAADIVVDNLECSADPVPWTLVMRRGAGTPQLQWSGLGVLEEGDTPEGPWKPWCGLVACTSGTYRTTCTPAGQGKFFRLVSGAYGVDLFNSSWEGEERSLVAPVRGGRTLPGLTVAQGRGRILGNGSRNADFLLHDEFGYPFQQDAVASVDIVDWDETMEDAAFGIVLRANPGKEFWFPRQDGLPPNRYAGMLTFRKAGSPSESVLSLTGPGGEPLEVRRFPAVDPGKRYRLRFWAVGDRLTLELFDLDNNLEQPVETCEATDGRVAEGMDALYGTKSNGDTYDVTIDRYQVTATRR